MKLRPLLAKNRQNEIKERKGKSMKTYKVTITVEYTKNVQAESEDDAINRANHHITCSAEYQSKNTVGSIAELIEDDEENNGEEN
jgi:hypothetical protein